MTTPRTAQPKRPAQLQGTEAPEVSRDAVIDALAQTAFLVMGVLSRVSAEHELSLTQLRVLAILRGRRLRMTALADYLGLDKSTLSGLVDRAQRRGLLDRTASTADRRATEVSLTPQGRRLAARGSDHVRSQLVDRVSRLTVADQRRLVDLLATLLAEPTG